MIRGTPVAALTMRGTKENVLRKMENSISALAALLRACPRQRISMLEPIFYFLEILRLDGMIHAYGKYVAECEDE